MPWHTSDRMIALRDKSRTLDIFVEMLDGWRLHLSGRNASLISFFGFLSIFPLALAATTVLGRVLDGNEDLQQRVADGAFNDIPFEHRCGGIHEGDKQGEQGEKDGGNHIPNLGASTHENEPVSGGMLTVRGAQVRSTRRACQAPKSGKRKIPLRRFGAGPT